MLISLRKIDKAKSSLLKLEKLVILEIMISSYLDFDIWLSSSACDHCCAYQLICIMTIGTYTTGARTHFFTVQEPS